MRPVLDVRAYGAVGDGVADDRPAVVRALYRAWVASGEDLRREPRFDPAHGAVLYFPPGRYRIAGCLNRMLEYDDLSVVGAGPGATTLVFDQAGGDPHPPVPSQLRGLARLSPGGHARLVTRRLEVAHLTLTTELPAPHDLPRRSMGAAPLSIGWCHGVRVVDVEVAGAHNFGIFIYDCTDVTVQDCHIHDTNLDGLGVARSEGVALRRCHIHDTGDDAIGISGTDERPCRDVLIEDNELSRIGSNGVSLFGVDGAVVRGNQVRGTYMCGITVRVAARCGSSRNVLITGNEVEDAGLYPTEAAPPRVPTWGGGAPYGIAVVNDSAEDPDHPDHLDVTLGPVDVRNNRITGCRNSFVALQRAEAVTIADNELIAPLVTGPRPFDRGAGDSYAECSGVFPPADPDEAGQDEPVPIRISDSRDVTIGDNDVDCAEAPAS